MKAEMEEVTKEDALYSKVYQYGNHKDEGWEMKGEVLGYA